MRQTGPQDLLGGRSAQDTSWYKSYNVPVDDLWTTLPPSVLTMEPMRKSCGWGPGSELPPSSSELLLEDEELLAGWWKLLLVLRDALARRCAPDRRVPREEKEPFSFRLRRLWSRVPLTGAARAPAPSALLERRLAPKAATLAELGHLGEVIAAARAFCNAAFVAIASIADRLSAPAFCTAGGASGSAVLDAGDLSRLANRLMNPFRPSTHLCASCAEGSIPRASFATALSSLVFPPC
mmetsp:Transcript_7977/g.24823  ORF Transcript_7977/g.24823 Transcript_7977/m.24823 type:complete len:238 (+) Transcript_7977:950-1663(+)